MKTLAKLSAIFLAAAVCAAWPAQAQTDTPAPTTNAPAAPKPPRVSTTYRGTIASIDSTNMILSLKGRGANPGSKVKVTSATKIYKDRQKTPGLFSDLAEGTRIQGSGKKEDDGTWTAHTLYIMPAAAPKPTPAPAQ